MFVPSKLAPREPLPTSRMRRRVKRTLMISSKLIPSKWHGIRVGGSPASYKHPEKAPKGSEYMTWPLGISAYSNLKLKSIMAWYLANELWCCTPLYVRKVLERNMSPERPRFIRLTYMRSMNKCSAPPGCNASSGWGASTPGIREPRMEAPRSWQPVRHAVNNDIAVVMTPLMNPQWSFLL